MQEIHSPKPKDSSSEQQLSELRDQLFALSKTEENLKDLREKSISSETLDIDPILDLWQTIYRETFEEYQKLSSQLPYNQDKRVLDLLKQYLEYVQSYLSTEIPADYTRLKEHRQLCDVHENLLSSHKSLLSMHIQMVCEKQTDDSLLEQYQTLNSRHNDILSEVTQRKEDISDRIDAWRTYRKEKAALQEWIKEQEKQRSKLQFHYVQIKRIPKILQRLQLMLNAIPTGEAMAKKLQDQQDNLLSTSDDAFATSVRMEYNTIIQRINNLRTAIESWNKYFVRIVQLLKSYEVEIGAIQSQFKDLQTLIENINTNMPTDANTTKNILVNLRSEKVKLKGIVTKLENLGLIQEELKECLSPHDIKSLRHSLWILWQQQHDLDVQLSVLINAIEERLALQAAFSTRYERIMNWIEELENKACSDPDSGLYQNPEEMIRSLERDTQLEIMLREKEREWLLLTGRELLSYYTGDATEGIRQNLQISLHTLVERWERLKYLYSQRTIKVEEVRNTIFKLEERIAAIRQWLFEMEIQLSKPLAFESLEPEALKTAIKDHEKMQRSIEQQSSDIGEVLNLCEMLLTDDDARKTNLNMSSIKNAIDNLEKRWKRVCSSSVERKKNITIVWDILQLIRTSVSENSEWVIQQENAVDAFEKALGRTTKDNAQQQVKEVENLIREIESKEPIFNGLKQSFAKLATTTFLDRETTERLISPAKEIVIRWQTLVTRAYNIMETLSKDMRIYLEFVNNRGKIIFTLTQIDAKLTQLQHLASPDTSPTDEKNKLDQLQKELHEVDKIIEKTDKLGAEVKKKAVNKDEIDGMINEYHNLFKDIQSRITASKIQIDESIQVNTLNMQQVSAVQVNTLDQPKLITAKDAYLMELTSALDECRDSLNKLQILIRDEKKPVSTKVSKAVASCQSSIDLIKHLSTLLIGECGSTSEEALSDIVLELTLLFATLQTQWKTKQQHNANVR